MTEQAATTMDSIEIREFLQDQGTGVLALAKASDAYAVPVSFFYDGEQQCVYLRLGYASGSQKRRYAKATDHASLVVYDDTDEGWKSVVIEGHLEEISDNTLDSALEEHGEQLDIPYVRIFDRPTDEIEFRTVRINITSMKGIVGS